MRELARNGQREWRQDPALRPAALVALASSPTPESKTVKTVFEDLRLQVEQLCTLGTKQRPVPGQALALYCSTILAFIAEYALRGLARIVERDPVRSEGRTAELFAAMGEDEALWSCFEGMRTRSYIERDLAVSRKASTTRCVCPQKTCTINGGETTLTSRAVVEPYPVRAAAARTNPVLSQLCPLRLQVQQIAIEVARCSVRGRGAILSSERPSRRIRRGRALCRQLSSSTWRDRRPRGRRGAVARTQR